MISWDTDVDNQKFLPTKDGKFIYKEDFKNVFGKLNNYDSLIKHEKTSPYWKDVFDDWKQKGILN